MAGKKFRFSLEQVLSLRRHETERAEQSLARAQQARLAREAHLDEAEATLQTLTQDAPGTGTPHDFRRFAATQQEAMRARARARMALDAAHQHESKARTGLVEARRPEEALHTLREKEEARHRRAREHAEIAFLDDQASSAYLRQRHNDS